MIEFFRNLLNSDLNKDKLKSVPSYTVAEIQKRYVQMSSGTVPVRLIPKKLLQYSRNLWKETGDIKPVIESLYTSFFVFRACVCQHIFVPLIRKNDGNWEWPDPVGFSWGDQQTKELARIFGAYEMQYFAEIKTNENGRIKTFFPAAGLSMYTDEEQLRDHPDEIIKFQIPSFHEIRMINQQSWQQHSLKTWAGRNHLASAFSDMLDDKLRVDDANLHFTTMIDYLEKHPLNMPIRDFF